MAIDQFLVMNGLAARADKGKATLGDNRNQTCKCEPMTGAEVFGRYAQPQAPESSTRACNFGSLSSDVSS